MVELIKLLATYGEMVLCEQSHNIIALLDGIGNLLEWNSGIERLFQLQPAVCQNLHQLIVFSSQPRFQILLHEAIHHQKPGRGQLNFATGEIDLPTTYDCWFIPVPEQRVLLYAELVPPLDHKSAQEYFRITNDLATTTRELQKARHALVMKQVALEAALAQVQEISYTDELTGLPNRRRALTFLSEEANRVESTYPTVSIFLLDIDHFKQINDHYGHAAGDSVLKQIAEILGRSLRKADCIGRHGGEEFLAILPNTSLDIATAVAHRVRQQIEVAPFCVGEQQSIHLTVSIGVAQFHPPEDIIQSLLVRADQALYRAKEAGRNRVYIAEDEAWQVRESGGQV